MTIKWPCLQPSIQVVDDARTVNPELNIVLGRGRASAVEPHDGLEVVLIPRCIVGHDAALEIGGAVRMQAHFDDAEEHLLHLVAVFALFLA